MPYLCPESQHVDGSHCDCWWADTSDCCWCGDDGEERTPPLAEPESISARNERRGDDHERLNARADGKVPGVDR